jgi:hypothetical protein
VRLAGRLARVFVFLAIFFLRKEEEERKDFLDFTPDFIFLIF